ncbi:unnamed protein product [Urochloa decumbens]|uniref:DUF4220 domain-containing protein n=1 Tax=Urochloa decumbens TaxID=240449 RepID=A0ABC9GT29_9POAL
MALAGTRRRRGFPGWKLALWLSYQLLDKAGSYALSSLSLDINGDEAAAAREQLLVAFWAPFLLLHLGGPDNIGAYSIDDDKLSWRKVLDAAATVMGASYVVYSKLYIVDSGLLRPASIIMAVVGILRFLEKAVTLRRALSKKNWGSSNAEPMELHCCGNIDTLVYAQHQFQNCGRRIIFDSSVEKNSHNLEASREIFSLGSKDICKVVEMEASLIFDMLYTKAAVVHTWGGYLLRLISPLTTATAAFLFWLYPKDCVERVDVIITYILLAAAFVLDVVWLVMALGSTWAYAFMNCRPGVWLHRQVLCSGWWHLFRSIAVSLHPCRLLGRDPSSYRLWPGTIGQFNLLQDCTRAPGSMACLCSWLATKVGLEEAWDEFRFWRCLSELPEDVKELLFERITQRLKHETADMKDIGAQWGQGAVKRRRMKIFHGQDLPFFGREFQEDILLWHIGTAIYLWSGCHQQQLIMGANAETTTLLKAIMAVSEYLMFLIVARPHMLPDPALRRLYNVTRQALKEEWDQVKDTSLRGAATKEHLAEMLRSKEKSRKLGSDVNRLLISDAARLAILLQESEPSQVKDLVELIFDVWVDKLLYAGIRCSRESHARQLGQGGELITIVWTVAEHAGIFCIGETYDKPIDDDEGPNSPLHVIWGLRPPF